MGLSIINFEFMTNCFQKLIPKGVKGKWMLELGSQRIRDDVREKQKISQIIAKKYFESLGIKHYSIDKNGEEGAIPINLSKPITDAFWINRFDIGTNFGTLEHVSENRYGQYEAWKNFHNALKVDSFFIHSLPHPDGWPTHCHIRYDNEFVEKLSAANNYQIIFNDLSKGKTKKALTQACLVKKTNDNFMENKDLFYTWIDIRK